MSRNSQRVPREATVCPACRKGECAGCVDLLLSRVGRSVGCGCRRAEHSV